MSEKFQDKYRIPTNHLHGIILLTGNEKNGDEYFGSYDDDDIGADVQLDTDDDTVETRHA